MPALVGDVHPRGPGQRQAKRPAWIGTTTTAKIPTREWSSIAANLPKDVFVEKGECKPVMDYQEIIAGTVGKENTYGTIVGRVKAAPFTYLRVSTDDAAGRIRSYIGEGELTDDPLATFGGYGVVKIPNFQKLLRYICETGFEHHVAINPTRVSAGVKEALGKYLGWDVYLHE
jgi:L-fucose isomerase-like protein